MPEWEETTRVKNFPRFSTFLTKLDFNNNFVEIEGFCLKTYKNFSSLSWTSLSHWKSYLEFVMEIL